MRPRPLASLYSIVRGRNRRRSLSEFHHHVVCLQNVSALFDDHFTVGQGSSVQLYGGISECACESDTCVANDIGIKRYVSGRFTSASFPKDEAQLRLLTTKSTVLHQRGSRPVLCVVCLKSLLKKKLQFPPFAPSHDLSWIRIIHGRHRCDHISRCGYPCLLAVPRSIA